MLRALIINGDTIVLPSVLRGSNEQSDCAEGEKTLQTVQ